MVWTPFGAIPLRTVLFRELGDLCAKFVQPLGSRKHCCVSESIIVRAGFGAEQCQIASVEAASDHYLAGSTLHLQIEAGTMLSRNIR